MDESTFFDAHLHLFDLRHPSYMAFVENLATRPGEMVLNQILSPSFLMGSLGGRGTRRLKNLLSVVDRGIDRQVILLEDDLLGSYGSKESIKDGVFRFCGKEFRKIALIPLVMDFSQAGLKARHIAYDVPDEKSPETQFDDLLEGLARYRKARPGGLFDFYPFAGIHVSHHTMASLSAFLERLFPGAEETEAMGKRSLFSAFSGMKARKRDRWLAHGIKLYPPLGADPWPDDFKEREKAELLFSFCERNKIPVVTHCDDQGFRAIPVDQALIIGSPERWIPVLKLFPCLKVDFAHFGKRYFRRFGEPERTDWTETIVRLILEYENVHADIAFNGVDPRYYRQLAGLLAKMDYDDRAVLEGRIMFGSDFPVNLLLVDSYSAYIHRFESAPLEETLKLDMATAVPRKFICG